MNDIIQFPKDRIVRESPSLIEMNEVLNKARKKGITNFCDQLSEEIIHTVLDMLDNSGIETETELFQKDIALTSDALRATIYRSMGISHPLHNFIDNHIDVVPKDELLDDTETVEKEDCDDDSDDAARDD